MNDNALTPQSDNLDGKQLMRQTVTTHYSGPLPPPSELAKYEQVIPGAAERILKMAEEQSAHRKNLEEKVIVSDIQNSRRGQIFGFIIGMTAIISGAVLVAIDKKYIGGFLSFGSIATLAGVFVYGSRQRKQERLQREEIRINKNA